MKREVHLVGSVPLADADEVFRAVGATLGDHIARLPDGETGARKNWISWQYPLFAEHPALERDPAPVPEYRYPLIRLRAGASASDVRFGPLGYAAHAIESYARFARLKADGVIAAGARFLVSLPTPLAPVATFVTPQQIPLLAPRYAEALMGELAAIGAAVPHAELAVQWDVAVEMAVWEGVFPRPPGDWQTPIVDGLARLGAAVPADVELGYHLCYGDRNHQHFKQPEDAGALVDVATRVFAKLPRAPAWLHVPVPRDRDDDAYFAPLARLALPKPTRLFLGLVHFTDGLEGARRRMAAASRVVDGFGVATECGLGRRDPSTIPALLRLHADIADAPRE